WSLAKLAEVLGTTTRTVSRWEQGLAVPYPYYREQLCILYDKTAEELGLLSDTKQSDVVVEEAIPPAVPSTGVPEPVVPVVPVPHGSFLADPAIPEALGSTDSLLGRTNLLTQVKERLLQSNTPPLTALNGLPGIGKTSLAVALAADQQVQAHFYDGILWTALGPHPNVLSLLARWGKLLGITPTDIEDATSRESWGQALRAAIGHYQILLIIDDAWSAEDALAFRIGGAQCAHLLTTRMPQVAFAFAQEGAIVVPELEEANGLALLAYFVPQLIQQDPHGALALVRRVGGLPLALTLMGKYLAAQAFTGQPRRLQAALAQLQDTQQRLRVSMPTPLKQRSPSLPDNMPVSLYAAIAISDQQLSPQAHDSLCALSVFPPKPNTFSEEAALAVSQKSVEMLDTLWDAGLLESQGPKRYTLQQTIADYARTRAKGSEARQHLVNYMLEYVQVHEQDYKALELELLNIMAALDTANTLNMSDAVVQGVTALVPFMRVRGLYTQANHYLQLALKAATAIKDQIGCMTVLRHLAAFASLCGEYSRAEAYGLQGLTLAQDLGQIDVESDLLTILGQVAFRRSDYAESTAFYELGLQLARQMGNDERISTLLCYLGKNVSRYQGNYIQAESLYQEGLTIARHIEHQELMCRLLAYLGGVAVRQANYAQAERYCLEGLTLARQLGHRENLGFLLSNLGTIVWERGNYKQAEAYFEEALTLARQIGNRKQICHILAYLGQVLTFPFQDKYAQAKLYLQEGIDLARQIGDRSALPLLLMSLGATFGGQGDYSRANSYLQESVELGRRHGSAWEIVVALTVWGLLHLKYQQLDAATTLFQEILTHENSTKWDPQLIAAAQYGLAQVAALRGDVRQARRLGEECLAGFEAIEHYWAEKVRDWLHSLPTKDDTLSQ
ncbi:MAG TPA: tetratricopeptide repeat protein, partial [Ktedonobacteraceae bacterium]|nr:tetratricopeptide repeat protein [Ktedonobacteraceae bacterium]